MSLRALHRLTGLLHPEWELRLGPSGSPRRSRGERGVLLSEVQGAGRISGGAPVESAARCSYAGCELEGPLLVGLCTLSVFDGARVRGLRAEAGAQLRACRLREARLDQPEAAALEILASDVLGLVVEGGELGAIELCDARHARLKGLRLHRAQSTDFTAAVLEGCDLTGADLRGACFRRAELKDCKLDGALVEGADFAGARGLGSEQKTALIRGGARFRGAGFHKLAARFASDPLQREKLAFGLQIGSWVAAFLVCGGAALSALSPPTAVETSPIPAALERVATQDDREKTQEELRRLRDGIQRAHEDMLRNGAQRVTWPSIIDLQENRYDLDGEGPRSDYGTLVSGGLPRNLLTASNGGVLPYCNEVPDQNTLTGVDTDWHYCEDSGRVFASAGFTDEPTLNW